MNWQFVGERVNWQLVEGGGVVGRTGDRAMQAGRRVDGRAGGRRPGGWRENGGMRTSGGQRAGGRVGGWKDGWTVD